MRRVKYTGKPCNLGVHGDVKTGAILQMTERSIELVEANEPKRFKILDELTEPETYVLPVAVKGVKDLRLIQWDAPDFYKYLRRRGRSELFKMARAMVILGVELGTISKTTSSPILADAIYREAKRQGWTLRGKGQNKTLGIYDRENPDTHAIHLLAEVDSPPESVDAVIEPEPEPVAEPEPTPEPEPEPETPKVDEAAPVAEPSPAPKSKRSRTRKRKN